MAVMESFIFVAIILLGWHLPRECSREFCDQKSMTGPTNMNAFFRSKTWRLKAVKFAPGAHQRRGRKKRLGRRWREANFPPSCKNLNAALLTKL